jgi:hypothetical protein
LCKTTIASFKISEMFKSLFSIPGLILILCLQLQGQNVVDLPDFKKIEVAGGFEIELVRSNANKAIVKMKSGNFSDLEISVKGSTLNIRAKSKLFQGNAKAKIKLEYKNMEGIAVSAGGSVVSDDLISSEKMEVSASSGASVKLEIHSKNVGLSASSGGSLSLRGKANNAIIKASSGGSVAAGQFRVKKADVKASSGGSVIIDVSEEINSNSSSGGTIKYTGNPQKVMEKSSLSGDVKRG